MAWPIGRLWRVCMVGVGVCRRWCTVCMALAYGVYGVVWVRCTVLWRWVYVWLACVYALGVRCAGVCGYGVYVDTLTW